MTSIRLAEIHGFIVHFPIALLLISVTLDIAAAIFRRASLVEAATWTLLLGVPGVALAGFTGWLSERTTNVGVAPEFLHYHKATALLAAVVFATLFLARLLWISSRIVGWLRLAFPRSRRLANLHVWLVKSLPQAYGRPASRGLIALYLLLSLMGVALLLATGYLGEAMVYRFGMCIFNPTAPLP
jgi:uncharacterized membrane protein